MFAIFVCGVWTPATPAFRMYVCIFCICTAWAMLCGHGLHRLVIIPILPHSQFVASVLTLLTVDNNQPTAKNHHIGINCNS